MDTNENKKANFTLKGGESMYSSEIKNAYFTLYRRQTVVAGRVVTRFSIVLKDRETGLIIRITDYADYAFYLKDKLSVHAEDPDRLYSVCQMLDFILIKNYPIYGLTDLAGMTKEMMQAFLDDYAMTELPTGGYPDLETVRAKREAISEFALSLIEAGRLPLISKGDLVETTYIKDKRVVVPINKYLLRTRAIKRPSGYKKLLRDMPYAIAERLLIMTELYDPDLTCAVALGLYAGLREGEICNMRLNTSIHGPCFKFTFVGDSCTGIEIDLTKERVLRSDGKCVGKIKKERTQMVYSGFCQMLYDFYKKHLERTKDREREKYAPLFISKRMSSEGYYPAMTTSGFRERLAKIFFDHVLPSCKDDPDPDLRLYYLQMQGRTWGGHALRHWYTVTLVLLGVDNVAALMAYRGDKSPRSAMVYLQHKGEIERRYKAASETLGKMIRKE